MADNVNITPGTGKTIAADDIGGVLHQRIKLIHGIDGINDGDVSSVNPLPITLPSSQISTLTPPAAITNYAQETGGNLATIAGKDFATETTLSAIALAQQTDALTDIELRATPVPVSVSGVATSAKQDTGNASLASLDGKTPALGQALASASVPVILPSATITTLTPPAAITGYATETTLASIKSTDGIKKITDALPAGTNNIGDVDIASAIPAGENHTGEVGTNGVSVGVELTRPADTTAYAINDAVADSTSSPTVLTFTNLGRVNAGSGYIVKAILSTDQKTNVAQFRLHLFNASPTAVNDNALLGILYADNASYIGCIDFPVMATEDSTASTKAYGIWTGQLHFVCGASTHTLYGLLETKTVFTPASGQKFYIKLNADNN